MQTTELLVLVLGSDNYSIKWHFLVFGLMLLIYLIMITLRAFAFTRIGNFLWQIHCTDIKHERLVNLRSFK